MNVTKRNFKLLVLIFLASVILLCEPQILKAGQRPDVDFQLMPGKVMIKIGGEPFATYFFEEDDPPRPFFAHVKSPSGIQATRNFPPIKGKDPTDHDKWHPGIWLAFGDISGNDYWRADAKVEHEMFLEKPKGGKGMGTFTVSNYYREQGTDDRLVHEICQYKILAYEDCYMILYDSIFSSDKTDFYFGDQEEMGLGIRVATPITVEYGKGHIYNAKGDVDEDGVWGYRGGQSDWVDLSGVIDDTYVGMMVMPDPRNFRGSWYHARDYGFVAANPFGKKAMFDGSGKDIEKSKTVVKKGEKFHLGFGIAVYSKPDENSVDRDDIYIKYLQTLLKKDKKQNCKD